MKRFILFTFSLLLTFTFAIAQDGINYQGAATDANGDELTNQNISIRASVLSASASGNLEWEETHSATTDQFGLFNVVIGQGNNTTNGATATFDDMDWGSGNHFLKIEMDATGGTNYAMIGTTQMMSVPYALYAKSAGIDSTMLANMIGSSGGGMGGGCDYNFPEGLDGEAVLTDILNTNYTIPNGKNFYLISTNLSCLCSASILVNGLPILESGGNGSMTSISEGTIVLTSGDVISHNNVGSVTRANIYGLLVDKIVDPILLDIFNTNYTVPSGKNLYIRSAFSNSGAQAQIQVNGTTFFNADNGTINSTTSYMPFILNSGDVLSYLSGSSTSATMIYITGYLADENYFSNCGGGSSSATSSLDSTAIANMIAGAGGGCDYSWPEGLSGEPITIDLFNTGSYTVPSNKSLYIINQQGGGGGGWISVDGNSVFEYGTASLFSTNVLSPFIAKSGDVVNYTGSPNYLTVSGVLIDANQEIEPIIIDFITTGNYTVPSGKNFYISGSQKSNGGFSEIKINGNVIADISTAQLGSTIAATPYIAKSGDVVDVTGTPTMVNVFGYLADENYFAGCGGSSDGGNSDSNNGGSGGCDFNYPDGLDGVSVTHDLGLSSYIVPLGKNLYITNLFSTSGYEFYVDGIIISEGEVNYQSSNGGKPFVISSGQIISSNYSGSNRTNFNGILVTSNISPITYDLGPTTYTVPNGNNLYITNLFSSGNYEIFVDGISISNSENNFQTSRGGEPFMIASGQVISVPNTSINNQSTFNGYLANENYFANCGGGGSTTTSSTSWNSTVPFLQSVSWPQGRIGESISINFSIGSSYTVPAGKNLYVGQTYDVGNPEFTISDNLGNSVFLNQSFTPVSVLGEGYTITLTSCFMGACSDFWSGKLIDKQYIEPTIITFSTSSLSYTVPSGKVLVSLMYNDFNQSAQEGDWSYNGYLGANGPSSSNPVEENQTITYVPNSSNPTVPAYIFGYLINY